jgi:hypothetical protein
MKLLALAAAGEAALAVALLLDPRLVYQWLLGADASGAALVMGRVAGIALLGLALACWPERGTSGHRAALRAMATYNALATLYLLGLGLGGTWVGPLLWPAGILHAVVTAGCLVALRREGPAGEPRRKAPVEASP